MSFAPELEIICDIIFYIYLFWAAWQDHQKKAVVRGTHLLGFAAALSELNKPPMNAGGTAVLFCCLLCEAVCCYFHFYGLADSLVFVNCCLYIWEGTDVFMGFFMFWWMKACSGLLLLCGEMIRRRRVTIKLEEPRAYIPWILGAFALTNAVLKGYNM